jgi:ABC-type multidrug transport system fused ATPase/permease subunit
MTKRKKRYTLFSNLSFAHKGLWSMSKLASVFAALSVFLNTAQPLTYMLMPKLLVDQLEKGASTGEFALVIGGMALIIIVVQFLHGNAFARMIFDCSTFFQQYIHVLMTDKEMEMDYELLENPEVISLHDKARSLTKKFAGQGDGSSASANSNDIIPRFANLVTGVLGLIVFGGIISMVHPFIIALLLISFAINYYMLKYVNKYEQSTRAKRGKLDKKIRYLISISGANGAKDIRLYSMVEWLKNMAASIISDIKQENRSIQKRQLGAAFVDLFLILLRDGAAYVYLVYLVLNGRITTGNFLLVFAAIGQFSGWINNIIYSSMDLSRCSTAVSDVRSFLDLENKTIRTGGTGVNALGSMPPSLKLSNVSYTYSNSDKSAIRDINIEIKSGERIAIVGVNGAGKTTLVKLICGLYKDYSGTIVINNTSIDEINLGEYFSMIAPVFQDIHLMTLSIAENVSQANRGETDYAKVKDCLIRAGLWDKVDALPDKENTLLVKSVNENATEFSGGELQKLALARALYKNSPVLILDEPTAALDPIAENEVYRQYAALTEGKTSIFISHRLASTRFCDRILFLEDHVIKEIGTHDELMSLGGMYAEMFNIQASYYKSESVVG